MPNPKSDYALAPRLGNLLLELEEHMARRVNRLISDVFKRFLEAIESQPGRRPLTLKGYRQCVPLVEVAFGAARVADMSEDLTTAARDRLHAAGYKASTTQRRMGQFKTAWGWALRNELAWKPWCKPRRFAGVGRKKELRSGKRPYSVPELYRVLLAMPEPHRRPVLLMAENGCRPSEACAANTEDFEVNARCVWWTIHDSKTGVGRRVPVTLDTWRSIRPVEPGPLFVGRGGRRMTPTAIAHALVKVLTVLPGPDGHAPMRRAVHKGRNRVVWDLDVASLRRSFVDHAEAAGVRDLYRMAVVGHELSGVHDGYRRNAVRDAHLLAAVETTRSWRRDSIRPVADSRTLAHNQPQDRVLRAASNRRWTAPNGVSDAVLAALFSLEVGRE